MGALRLLFNLICGHFIMFIFVFVIMSIDNDESDLSATIPIILWVMWMQWCTCCLLLFVCQGRREQGRKEGREETEKGLQTVGLLSCSNNG